MFHDNSAVPTNFGSGFLGNSDNERDFYPYLIDKIISKTRVDDGVAIETSNEKALMNRKGILSKGNLPRMLSC